MAFLSERVEKQAAVHMIAQSTDEELAKAADERYEGIKLAMALANHIHADKVPLSVRKMIYEDPDGFLENAGSVIAEELGDKPAESLLPDSITKAGDRMAQVKQAMAAAKKKYDGKIPGKVRAEIFKNPGKFLESDEDEGEEDEGESSTEKAYVGFAKLVAQLMAKNPDWSRERAEAVAASIGRKKWGAKFQSAAKRGAKLG